MSRCYILGAGFSKQFGYPLASELTSDVFQHLSSSANGTGLEPTRQAHTHWKTYLRQLYPCCDFKDTWPDFEDLITVLDEWEMYRCDVQGTPTPQSTVNTPHIKRVLLKHLALLLHEKTPAQNADRLVSVSRFVKCCAENRWPVISFNWDVLLEAAAMDVDKSVKYDGDDEGWLLLAKPHGSINVARIEKQFAGRWRGMSNVTKLAENGDSVVVSATKPRETQHAIIDPLGVSGNNSSVSSTPKGALLVAPTARKTYKDSWYIQQWQRAYKWVRAADEIVVIGFSLPPTDYRPRVLLQLAGIDRNPSPRLLLVDPNACQVAEKYRRAVPLPIECYQGGWIEWSAKDS